MSFFLVFDFFVTVSGQAGELSSGRQPMFAQNLCGTGRGECPVRQFSHAPVRHSAQPPQRIRHLSSISPGPGRCPGVHYSLSALCPAHAPYPPKHAKSCSNSAQYLLIYNFVTISRRCICRHTAVFSFLSCLGHQKRTAPFWWAARVKIALAKPCFSGCAGWWWPKQNRSSATPHPRWW